MAKTQAKPEAAQSNCAATERAPVDLTDEGPKPSVAKPKYLVTAKEKVALDKVCARLRENTAPSLKVVKSDGGPLIVPDHSNPNVGFTLLVEAYGCADQEFLWGLFSQMADVCSRDGKIDEIDLNFMASVIKGIKPQNQIESMLAAQMAITQILTMRSARRLLQSQSLPEQDSNERAFNKFARTYTSQVQALKLNRSSGEQSVTVQNVSVSDGSQAIVTKNFTHQAPEKAAHSTAAITDARAVPMPVLDTQKPRIVPAWRKSDT
jgi:hypothetical protein